MKWFLISLWTFQPIAGPYETLGQCEEMHQLYARGSRPMPVASTRCELRDEKNRGRR